MRFECIPQEYVGALLAAPVKQHRHPVRAIPRDRPVVAKYLENNNYIMGRHRGLPLHNPSNSVANPIRAQQAAPLQGHMP